MTVEIDTKHELFHRYYKRWISIYKEGAIRDVTLQKYEMTHQWLVKANPKRRSLPAHENRLSRIVKRLRRISRTTNHYGLSSPTKSSHSRCC